MFESKALNRVLITLAALVPLALATAGCPKPLPKRKKLEIRRFEVPERKHETVARVQAMERSIESMKKAMASADERACTDDSQCTLAMQHCCTCATGGKRSAVRIDKNLAVAQRRQGLCKKVICPMQVSRDPTCVAEVEPKCVNQVCEAVPKTAPAEVPTEPIP